MKMTLRVIKELVFVLLLILVLPVLLPAKVISRVGADFAERRKVAIDQLLQDLDK